MISRRSFAATKLLSDSSGLFKSTDSEFVFSAIARHNSSSLGFTPCTDTSNGIYYSLTARCRTSGLALRSPVTQESYYCACIVKARLRPESAAPLGIHVKGWIIGMWPNKIWFAGLAGAFLLAATVLPPTWVWLARPLLIAAVMLALIAMFLWSRRRT
jgi:hypothetical protein